MDDLKIFCCLNPQCTDYGRRGLDNLRVCFSYGPSKATRVLACRTCQQRFSERKGTALYRCKLPEEKAVAVLHHLQEACGVRQTSRRVGVNKNTLVRLAVWAGRPAAHPRRGRSGATRANLVPPGRRKSTGSAKLADTRCRTTWTWQTSRSRCR